MHIILKITNPICIDFCWFRIVVFIIFEDPLLIAKEFEMAILKAFFSETVVSFSRSFAQSAPIAPHGLTTGAVPGALQGNFW